MSVEGRTSALKYDVDLQRLHHKRGQTNAGKLCVSEKRRRRKRGVKRRNGWGVGGERREKEELRQCFPWILVHSDLGGRPPD